MALLVTDRVDWARGPDGDLIVPIRYTTGLEAVEQGIRGRLELVRGEWFLDMDAGMPYLDGNGVDPALVILGRRFDRTRCEVSVRRQILRTPGVRAIAGLTIAYDSPARTVRISARVTTEFGDTVLDELVPL